MIARILIMKTSLCSFFIDWKCLQALSTMVGDLRVFGFGEKNLMTTMFKKSHDVDIGASPVDKIGGECYDFNLFVLVRHNCTDWCSLC